MTLQNRIAKIRVATKEMTRPNCPYTRLCKVCGQSMPIRGGKTIKRGVNVFRFICKACMEAQ